MKLSECKLGEIVSGFGLTDNTFKIGHIVGLGNNNGNTYPLVKWAGEQGSEGIEKYEKDLEIFKN